MVLRILPTIEQAAALFRMDGHQFFPPRAHVAGHVPRPNDGTTTDRTGNPPPPPDAPIPGHESVSHLGDENFVWRGYGENTRGVIKLRAGRFLEDVNAPSVAVAKRVARRVVDLLRREPQTHPPRE